ncbi:hypothetical protein [Alkalicoccobacillus murimartini]|uniref:Lipoprotein n=1 Tax=Alkalicoccobacillus murimartini TaxID=171685 RepID=A0ABT9YNM4_9BACI|nr:hypothetical protein [Alkalicoccobacillus murimartini]MDQ0208619.1 hypothetical protein [Alkalicoccobacillus murimartini]
MKKAVVATLYGSVIILGSCNSDDSSTESTETDSSDELTADNNAEDAVADPLMNEVPTVSVYNSENEEMETTSFAVCWNYCDETELIPLNEEGEIQNADVLNEVEHEETMQIVLDYDTSHTVSHELITFNDSTSFNEELEGETFDVRGQDDIQYAIITRFLNNDDETIGRIQTIFSVGIN